MFKVRTKKGPVLKKLSYYGGEFEIGSKTRIEILPDEEFFRSFRWKTIEVETHYNPSYQFETIEERVKAESLQDHENKYWAEKDLHCKIVKSLNENGLNHELADNLYIIVSHSRTLETHKRYDTLRNEAIQTRSLKEALEKIQANVYSVKSITFEIDDKAVYPKDGTHRFISEIKIDDEFVLVHFLNELVRKGPAPDSGILKYFDPVRLSYTDFSRIEQSNFNEFKLLFMADELLRENANELTGFQRNLLLAKLFDAVNFFNELKSRTKDDMVLSTSDDNLERIAKVVATRLSRGRAKFLETSKNNSQ